MILKRTWKLFSCSTTKSHIVIRLFEQLKQYQLIKISQTDRKRLRRTKHKRRRCRLYFVNKKRKLANLMCKSCGVHFYLGDCFVSYYLKEKY